MRLPRPELHKLRENAIAFGLACVNNRIGHLGSNKEHLIFEIRDSLIYRSWSVEWHVAHIERHFQVFERDLKGKLLEALDTPQLLSDHQQILHYLFDDVIFNCSSMFDYVGNLVGLTFLGPTKSRLKWNGALNSCRDEGGPIYSEPVADKLIAAHNSWVDALLSYRGDAVHHKVKLGSATHKFQLVGNDIEAQLEVTLPSAISKALFNNDRSIGLPEGAARIAEESAIHCNKVLECMCTTLRPDYW